MGFVKSWLPVWDAPMPDHDAQADNYVEVVFPIPCFSCSNGRCQDCQPEGCLCAFHDHEMPLR